MFLKFVSNSTIVCCGFFALVFVVVTFKILSLSVVFRTFNITGASVSSALDLSFGIGAL